ncbi:hypothetical protein FCM35_KLT05454 [Carex littledalei]|uniref:Uncharacterized protein n=1 Tax=Carex littledalei TaxID=544730 RepID=A0A833QXW7_9POAL|nr:hypothetical protein FCM35_KLT05454 [Carex littledalei]
MYDKFHNVGLLYEKQAKVQCMPIEERIARLMLPGPEEKQERKVVLWNGTLAANSFFNPTHVPTAQFAVLPRSSNSEPIIEEPMSSEEKQRVDEIPDFDDLFFDDPDEIPTINLHMESFFRNIEMIRSFRLKIVQRCWFCCLLLRPQFHHHS